MRMRQVNFDQLSIEGQITTIGFLNLSDWQLESDSDSKGHRTLTFILGYPWFGWTLCCRYGCIPRKYGVHFSGLECEIAGVHGRGGVATSAGRTANGLLP